jgi:hypothetical protein
MSRTKIYHVDKIHSLISDTTRPTRKHCNADAFIKALRKCFLTVPDGRQANKVEISMTDALMSGFAMFSLRDPSLLALDKRRKEEPGNLHSVFGIKDIACDSQMRV